MPYQSETTVTVDLPDHEDAELAVTYSYTPGRPGKYFGPPERCYEAEAPEVELLAIEHEGRDVRSLLTFKQLERIEEEIINKEGKQ